MEKTTTSSSIEKGEGERKDFGKPDYSFMFLDHLPIPTSDDSDTMILYDAMDCMGIFQKTGQRESLISAMACMYNYAQMQEVGLFVLDDVIEVWKVGAEKYAQWNWAAGMPWSKPIACIARHYLYIAEHGNPIDDESGLPHWAHIICNMQMLMLYMETYPEGNDLPYNCIEGGLL